MKMKNAIPNPYKQKRMKKPKSLISDLKPIKYTPIKFKPIKPWNPKKVSVPSFKFEDPLSGKNSFDALMKQINKTYSEFDRVIKEINKVQKAQPKQRRKKSETENQKFLRNLFGDLNYDPRNYPY